MTGETSRTEELGRGSEGGGFSVDEDSGRAVMLGRLSLGMKLYLGVVKLVEQKRCRDEDRLKAQRRKDMSANYSNLATASIWQYKLIDYCRRACEGLSAVQVTSSRGPASRWVTIGSEPPDGNAGSGRSGYERNVFKEVRCTLFMRYEI